VALRVTALVRSALFSTAVSASTCAFCGRCCGSVRSPSAYLSSLKGSLLMPGARPLLSLSNRTQHLRLDE